MTIEILFHLAEVDRRQLYLSLGYSSLFEYCVSHLGYGDSSAGRRVRAARVVKDYPEVYDLLKQEKLTFSGALHLSGALRPENKTTLLSRVAGKTQAQIERIVATFRPPKRIPDQARPTMVMKALERKPAETSESSSNARQPEPSQRALAVGAPEEMGHITRHSDGSNHPTHTLRPARVASKSTETRHIPASVKETIWIRDKGRCTYVGASGKQCNSGFNLQFDHHPVPFAMGGPSKPSNLRLLCAKHNRYTAKKTFGIRNFDNIPVQVAAKKQWVKCSRRRE